MVFYFRLSKVQFFLTQFHICAPVIVNERNSGLMVLRMKAEEEEEAVVGVASTRKPEMGSDLERQVKVMDESLTSEMRTRRGGLMSLWWTENKVTS